MNAISAASPSRCVKFQSISMLFENYYLKLFATLGSFFYFASSNAQIYPSTHYEIYSGYDLANRMIYVGKVNGIGSKQFDSLYKNEDLKFLPSLTRSTYPIEIRFSAGSIYAGDPSICTVLYYDTSFTLKRFRGKEKNMPLSLNADSVFNKLIENAIFSLPNFTESHFNGDTSYIYSSKGWQKLPFKIGELDHVGLYILDYKVGNLYNRIFIELNGYSMFPDNQLLRRYVEIKRILMAGL